MLTGVIYGAIVVAWAAYLVPLALRRNEQATRTRSIQRLSTAMRVLVRRGTRVAPSSSATRRVLSGGATAATRATVQLPSQPVQEPERVLVTPRPNRAAERAAAARRRTVLFALMALTLVVGVVAMLGLLPLWSVAVPVLLIAGFLVVARRSVRSANEPYWVEVPTDTSTDAEEPTVVRRAPAPALAPATGDGAEDTATAQPTVDGPEDAEPTIGLTAAQREAVAPTRVANGSTLWDPIPVTVPTYVDAPVVRRAFRTIKLGLEAAVVKDPAAPAKDADDGVADMPHAVNG